MLISPARVGGYPWLIHYRSRNVLSRGNGFRLTPLRQLARPRLIIAMTLMLTR